MQTKLARDLRDWAHDIEAQAARQQPKSEDWQGIRRKFTYEDQARLLMTAAEALSETATCVSDHKRLSAYADGLERDIAILEAQRARTRAGKISC